MGWPPKICTHILTHAWQNVTWKSFVNVYFKNILGDPVLDGVCASKPWSFSSTRKKIEPAALYKGRNMVFQKVSLRGLETTCRTVLLVDQSSPDFFSPNAGGNAVDQMFSRFLNISIRSGNIRDRSLKLSEVDPNFACFRPQIFFCRRPQILGHELCIKRN